VSPVPPSTEAPGELPASVAAYCDINDLLPHGARIGVGFSGGPDSLALLDLLMLIRPSAVAVAVHVDHGLQRVSAEMAAAAVAAGRALGVEVEVVPVCVDAAEIRERGVEAAARAARYAALDEAAARHRLDVVALGHTADDRAETLLLNLMRGTGLDGLAAMRPRRGRYVRPLLQLRRTDTASWCAARGLTPFEDPQNSDPSLARTRVRTELVPLLESLRPGSVGRIAAAASRLEQDADLLDEMAAAARAGLSDERPGSARLDVARLGEQARPIAVRVVRQALARLLGAAPLAAAVEAVLAARPGSLPGTRLVCRLDEQGGMVVRPSSASDPVGLPSSGSAEVFGRRVHVRSCPAGVTLTVRPLRHGDRAPWEKRTVTDRLARMGVQRRDRDDALVILSGDEIKGIVVAGVGWWGQPGGGVEVRLQEDGA